MSKQAIERKSVFYGPIKKENLEESELLSKVGLILSGRFQSDGELKRELQITPSFSHMSIEEFKSCLFMDDNSNKLILKLPQRDVEKIQHEDTNLDDNIGISEISFNLISFVTESGAEIVTSFEPYKRIIGQMEIIGKISSAQRKYLIHILNRLSTNKGNKIYFRAEYEEIQENVGGVAQNAVPDSGDQNANDTQPATQRTVATVGEAESNEGKEEEYDDDDDFGQGVENDSSRLLESYDETDLLTQSQKKKKRPPQRKQQNESNGESSSIEMQKLMPYIVLAVAATIGSGYAGLYVSNQFIEAIQLQTTETTTILVLFNTLFPIIIATILNHFGGEKDRTSQEYYKDLAVTIALSEVIITTVMDLPIFLYSGIREAMVNDFGIGHLSMAEQTIFIKEKIKELIIKVSEVCGGTIVFGLLFVIGKKIARNRRSKSE